MLRVFGYPVAMCYNMLGVVGSSLKKVKIFHATFGDVAYSGLLIFHAVAEPRISTKSAKSREIHQNMQNPRNSLEILPNTCRHNIFKSHLGCWGCLLAVNMLIYLETSSPQRVNNILKLPGVLRLMLRKTGKQR